MWLHSRRISPRRSATNHNWIGDRKIVNLRTGLPGALNDGAFPQMYALNPQRRRDVGFEFFYHFSL